MLINALHYTASRKVRPTRVRVNFFRVRPPYRQYPRTELVHRERLQTVSLFPDSAPDPNGTGHRANDR